MRKISRFTFLIICLSLLAVSCNITTTDYSTVAAIRGAFVINQGGDNMDGSITHYAADTLTQDLYESINNHSLGGNVTSASFGSDKGYFLVDNGSSQSIQKVNLDDFKAELSASEIINATDLASVSDTFVFVTSGIAGSEEVGEVHKLDATTLSSLGSVKVGKNPTKLAYDKGKLVYVANTDDVENAIMVMDFVKNEIIDTVKIEQVDEDGAILATLTQPVDMVIDNYKNLWVLCQGDGSTGAGLARISYIKHDVKIFAFNAYTKAKGRDCLARSLGGGSIYFITDDGTYAMGVFEDDLEYAEPMFSGDYEKVVFDAISVNSSTGEFYCANPSHNDDDTPNPGANRIIIFDNYGFNEDNNFIEVGENPGKCLFR